MKPVVLVVGVPASGKTTLCKRLDGRFRYVPHDDFKESEYPAALSSAAAFPANAAIGEIPFGISKIQGELESRGHRVVPVFILEEEPVLRARWTARGMTKPSTIQGHLTRQETYRARAHELGAFVGTSAQVLEHLQKLEL